MSTQYLKRITKSKKDIIRQSKIPSNIKLIPYKKTHSKRIHTSPIKTRKTAKKYDKIAQKIQINRSKTNNTINQKKLKHNQYILPIWH